MKICTNKNFPLYGMRWAADHKHVYKLILWNSSNNKLLFGTSYKQHLNNGQRVDVLAVEKAKVPNVLPSWA